MAQLLFTHSAVVGVGELLLPKSALLLWFITGKYFTKFASMCQNIFELEIMGEGEG